MSNVFWAMSRDGKLSLGSEYNAGRFRQFLKDNPNMRLKIEPLMPESNKQRRFFEGAVIPMITFYQEGMNYRDSEDNAKVREWLKIEFGAEMVVVAGKSTKVASSTKNRLQEGFLEKVTDWMQDQGYETELLNPEGYKYWRDTIFPSGGPDHYIDYLVETKKLKPR